MIQMKKAHKFKMVKPDRVEHHEKNGWSVVEEGAVTATLRPTKAEPTAEFDDSTMAFDDTEED
jgi:hypothetical protein